MRAIFLLCKVQMNTYMCPFKNYRFFSLLNSKKTAKVPKGKTKKCWKTKVRMEKSFNKAVSLFQKITSPIEYFSKLSLHFVVSAIVSTQLFSRIETEIKWLSKTIQTLLLHISIKVIAHWLHMIKNVSCHSEFISCKLKYWIWYTVPI